MSGHKRKRESKTTEISISSYNEEPSAVVGSFFNGFSVPSNTEFDVYKHKKSDKYIIHGENDTLDYNGETVDDEEENDYIVGLYDPKKKSIELYKAPFIPTRITSKDKRSFKGPEVKQLGIRNNEQRNALGEAFGTKKAKAAITNLERNRINSERLQDNELDIIDNIQESTKELPTREKMEESVLNDRPTPLANVDATSVEDIYPIHHIIPKKEWSFIRIDSILNESNDKARLELFPHSTSPFITKTLPLLVKQKNHEKIKLLFYSSLLLGVYNNRRTKDKQTLMTKLNDTVGEALIDGILERFSIARASQFGKSKERSFTIDPHSEDKLLCYLLATIFHINDFMIELAPLANELNMKPTRLIGLVRALGGLVKPITVGQAEGLGIPKGLMGSYKVATLKVPFKLPEMSRRVRR
ncbi:RNA polymerase I associated factor, A49-like protein, partial [Suhomyces tanzawaensis NRRL Y-17324]